MGPMTRFEFFFFDNYFPSSRCRAHSSIFPVNKVIQPKVEVTIVQAKLLMLPLRGLHGKHAVQRGICVPT
jgi:hypothetical protein